MAGGNLPYFDFLLSELGKHNPAIEKSFGRHVHWGYWDDPDNARLDDEDYARAAERLTLELCALARIVEGERVLDVGCGFGGTIASLNERFDSMQLTGLNIDARQLRRAREQVLPLRRNTIDFVEGDACALPFPDRSIDRVLAVECIFHFSSREKFFREAFRVLRPGGTLALSDFVPAAVFLPASYLASVRWFERFNFLGRCNIQSTIGRYRAMARRTGFVPAAERNITRHTVPTYRYLQRLVIRSAESNWVARASGPIVRLQEILALLKLLNYELLAFDKPQA